MEPLTQPNEKRYVLFPIQYPDIYNMYQKAQESYWTTHEIDLNQDKQDWIKLTDGQRRFISWVLAFFAASDGLVNENLVANFSMEVQIPEARAFYAFQTAIETVHSETYSLLIDTYIADSKERERLFDAVQTIPSVGKKTEWATKYMNRDTKSFAERIAAFSIVEGVFFSASFAAIFYIKTKGLMPGLCFSNTLIARDEGLHCDFASLIFSKCIHRPTQSTIHEMMKDAVEVEHQFVKDALMEDLVGMKSADMCEYVSFCADRLLRNLGYEALFRAKNPFDFMDLISVRDKTNFFERKVGEYNKAGVHQTDSHFSIHEEF